MGYNTVEGGKVIKDRERGEREGESRINSASSIDKETMKEEIQRTSHIKNTQLFHRIISFYPDC
jgi:hypothetical protein